MTEAEKELAQVNCEVLFNAPMTEAEKELAQVNCEVL